MSDISVSERRLLAALDRIDQFLDRGGMDRASPPGDDALAALRAELDAANTQIATLTSQLSGQDGRADMAEQAARLAAANDDLTAANRALIEAAAGAGDASRIESVSVALEAEIEALRAARAAEAVQLGALLAEVERLLAGNEAEASFKTTDDMTTGAADQTAPDGAGGDGASRSSHAEQENR